MEKKVFWSSIEYSYCIDAKEYKKLKGGFVYVFFKAFDVKEALSEIILEFNRIKLKPIDIEFLKPYETELEWESVEITNHYLDLCEKSNNSTNVIFDDFHAYESEI
ncbi:MAG: hypothetical protein WBG43_12270 [Marinifilaceae bacterium]